MKRLRRHTRLDMVVNTSTQWMQNTIAGGVENLSASGACGSVIRWGVRALLVVVLLGFMSSIVACAVNGFGRRARASTSSSGWDRAISVLGKSKISSVSASFKDAGVGAKMDRGKRVSDDEPDVGDACAVM